MRLGPGKLAQREDGKWCFAWSDARGTRRRQALSTDKRVAQRLAAELIRERDMQLAGLGAQDGQSRPLADLIEKYVEDLTLRTVPRHWQQTRRRLQKLDEALGQPLVREIQPYDVSRVRAKMVAAGVGHRTANLSGDTLRACLTWGVRMGLIAANPLASLPRLPEKSEHRRRVRRALSEDEISRFLAAAAEDDAIQLAHLAAVRTIEGGSKGVQWALRSRRVRIPQLPLWRAFLETGARYGELTSTTWRDVDLQRATLRLRAETTKSGKARVIPLTPVMVATLETLQADHQRILGGLGERLFLSPDGAKWPEPTTNAMRLFLRLIEKAGIERVDVEGRSVDLHALRHSFASRLARNGVGLVQAQKLLGHSDPKLTAKVYSHLEVEDLRDAIASLSKPTADRGDQWQQRRTS